MISAAARGDRPCRLGALGPSLAMSSADETDDDSGERGGRGEQSGQLGREASRPSDCVDELIEACVGFHVHRCCCI